MFSKIEPIANDPILNLSRLYNEDIRVDKIDVGVGVYQNAQGETPVMRAVKEAEQRVWLSQNSKKYFGLAGNVAFNEAMGKLVLDGAVPSSRYRVNQSIAGTGALRLIAETLASVKPQACVWVPDPTWGNHIPIFEAAGFEVKTYPYYDYEAAALRRSDFFEAMRALGPDDVVVLHGCCHNPSGEDLNREDWQTLADIALERGFLPVIDLAYLGFGDGIEEDAYGLRLLAKQVETMFIGVSCSKNFGLYRDRAGVAITIAANDRIAGALQSHLEAASRTMVSMPADHGAVVVAEILNDAELYQQWQEELSEMVANIKRYRRELADALFDVTGDEWSFITRQRGMFSLLPLGHERVERLREQYGIYVVGAGRINLAGLHRESSSMAFAQAIDAVLREPAKG
ncbi:aspartate/tyrosine/aromatic aminotransferase [Cardiobacteriaceae bacterium TAE3-ERU3]|nr:aspartate/tyrosine/aromatic aminotransferase [Cardiobacteriaceae bacterium TAE3-ERU3]